MKKLVSLVLVFMLALTSAAAAYAYTIVGDNYDQNNLATAASNLTVDSSAGDVKINVVSSSEQTDFLSSNYFTMPYSSYSIESNPQNRNFLTSIVPSNYTTEVFRGVRYLYFDYGSYLNVDTDFDNLCTLRFSNCMSGTDVDVLLTYDKIAFKANSSRQRYICIGAWGNTNSNVFSLGLSGITNTSSAYNNSDYNYNEYTHADFDITVTVVKGGTNTPIDNRISLLASNINVIKKPNTNYANGESWKSGANIENDFYVLPGCNLTVSKEQDGGYRWTTSYHEPPSENQYCSILAKATGPSASFTAHQGSYASDIKVTILSEMFSTYTVAYNPNGGTYTVGNSTETKFDPNDYAAGSSATVVANSGDFAMTRSGYTFTGWNTEANGSGSSYQPGNTVTVNDNLVLYAQWTQNKYIKYWDGSTLLQQTVIPTCATTHTLTASPITTPESGVTGIEGGIPTKAGYLFAGWYTTAQTPGTTSGAMFPQSITIADYDDANGDLNLYAAWVAKGTVSVDNSDPNKNAYGAASLIGFDLEGIQIKSHLIADAGVDHAEWEGAQYDGLRFITVYRNGMINELESLYATGNVNYVAASDTDVKYGYTMYAKTDIANLSALNANTSGAVDVDCTRDTNMNHKYFTDYRLSTVVVKYEGADQANVDALLEARAYVDYIDANGFARRGYDTYGDAANETMFAGGCRASFSQAQAALTRR